jgi:hypothetical protein
MYAVMSFRTVGVFAVFRKIQITATCFCILLHQQMEGKIYQSFTEHPCFSFCGNKGTIHSSLPGGKELQTHSKNKSSHLQTDVLVVPTGSICHIITTALINRSSRINSTVNAQPSTHHHVFGAIKWNSFLEKIKRVKKQRQLPVQSHRGSCVAG